jgi:hypothetical protein
LGCWTREQEKRRCVNKEICRRATEGARARDWKIGKGRVEEFMEVVSQVEGSIMNNEREAPNLC